MHGHDAITLSEVRSRLDQRRFSRPNTHFLALKFFQNLQENHLLASKLAIALQKFSEVCKILLEIWKFSDILRVFTKFKRYEILQNFADTLQIFAKSCRCWKMQNAKICDDFAEILKKFCKICMQCQVSEDDLKMLELAEEELHFLCCVARAQARAGILGRPLRRQLSQDWNFT